MKLVSLTLSGFQSFGPKPTTINFDDTTFLIGPNGSGKTAVLQALARLFAIDPNLRRIRRPDFHIPDGSSSEPTARSLRIEADFAFPELADGGEKNPTVAGFFLHMRLESTNAMPIVRFRLDATCDEDGDIEERMSYVCTPTGPGVEEKLAGVSKDERNALQVHYLPAQRDPADHISYAANALLGRALRAARWTDEVEKVSALTAALSGALKENAAVAGVGARIAKYWSVLHKGKYIANPSVSFGTHGVEGLLRHLTVNFQPGHLDNPLDFSRLSDGQKSLLYIALVLAMKDLARGVLSGKQNGFDPDKLRPPLFTLIAMEEPENSLSPHLLTRVVAALAKLSDHHDGQTVIATHSPSLLRRVPPEQIRHLRLDANRITTVHGIIMPNEKEEAYKYVREAVQAYPELYFARYVILGEGDSEEIILPRLLSAHGLTTDDAAIAVVPLGGRHVNHFWRLLHDLNIPHVTLLDLDLSRYQGGWGRLSYAAKQLKLFPRPGGTELDNAYIEKMPKWDEDKDPPGSEPWNAWIKLLEEKGGVYFSSPLDLDFAMIEELPEAYGIDEANELEMPNEKTVVAVLGKNNHKPELYTEKQRKLFGAYHRLFKCGSKPVAHLSALASLSDDNLKERTPSRSDDNLKERTPSSLKRLIERVSMDLAGLPE